MRIRIQVEDFCSARDTLRRRAAKHEWDTWDTVDVKLKSGKTVKRLIHVPKGDDQYKVVQIKLCDPSKEDRKKGFKYLDLVPFVTDSSLTEKQRRDKKGVVLGRFCEILNRYFPKLSGYRVILKER